MKNRSFENMAADELELDFDRKLRDALRPSLDEIKAEAALKNKTKMFIAAEFEKRSASSQVKARSGFNFKRAVMASMMVVVLLAAGLFYGTYTTQVAAISVDINPSLELGLNRFDKVISVESFNEDGDLLLSQISLKNKDMSEAILVILDLKSTSDEVSFTVAAEGENANRLLANLDQLRKNYGKNNAAGNSQGTQLQMQTYETSFQELKEAHRVDMSIGKYRAYRDMLDCGLKVTSDEAKQLSISEMQKMVDEQNGKQGAGAGYNRDSSPGETLSEASSSGSGDGRGEGTGDGSGDGSGYQGGKNP